VNHPLAPRVAAYLAGKLPGARDVAVEAMERISGGASRETYRFVARWTEAGQAHERRMILRRDPPASLIDTERRIEFEAYRAFFGSAVPVPEMLFLEEGAGPLDHPFFIAAEIAGFQASPQLPFESGDAAALDYWEGVIDEDELSPQPIIRAAIRWLRANPPPPAQKISVVHGDYRTGNFLYDTNGDIHGILDWEMSHLGDPLEDLGWTLNRIWCWAQDDLRGALLPREEAIAIWEKASGLKADPAALHWWELFNCVKGQGIWVSSAKAWSDGQNKDPILIVSSWRLLNAQDRAALELMGRL